MKIGLRIFFGFFLIVGMTAALSLKFMLDEMRPLVHQVAEAALVESAEMLAVLLAPAMQANGKLDAQMAQGLSRYYQQRINATIWQQHKTSLDQRITVTDSRGLVLFDSEERNLGQDFSRWNDIYLTLRGRYGTRTSRSDPDDEFSATMHVAAPIRSGERIIGVVSVAQANRSSQPYLERARATLTRYGLLLLFLSSAIGIGLTLWLIMSLRRIGAYAEQVSQHALLPLPQFAQGTELQRLVFALDHMRRELDGKSYVEDYVHSLTHELKSPLAAIRAAAELLEDEDMPAAQRAQFLLSIKSQGLRLQTLIERVLELAKLEQRRDALICERVLMPEMVQALLLELRPLLTAKNLSVRAALAPALTVQVDAFLWRQALRNVLDNAIHYAEVGSDIVLEAQRSSAGLVIAVRNIGPCLPAFALAKIPERFFSLPAADGSKGSGLGLSFVQEILRRHGGQLQLVNHAHGVEVRLLLPPSCC